MLKAWAETLGIQMKYIQPGKPQQNAYIERYNRIVRHEWPDQNIFETIQEALEHATRWLWTYNNESAQYGHRRDHTCYETETSCVILQKTLLKMGGLPFGNFCCRLMWQ